MTLPTTTRSRLGRVRAWIAKIPPSNERSMTLRVARGSFAALLAIAAVALTSTLATAGAPAAAPDDRST
jgi:hypothetical protein